METLIYVTWITLVIAGITFAFYWLFNKAKQKAEKIIQEEETIAYVNPLPETIQASTTRVVKPTPVRFDNESRVSRNSRTSVNHTSAIVSQPKVTRHDDWDCTNHNTRVIDYAVEYAREIPEQPYVISKGGSFGGAGASGKWEDDSASRVVAQVMGSAIGSAVATTVSNSFRQEEPSYQPEYKTPEPTYSFDSYETPSYESSSSSSSDSYSSSDW